ncbi:MAG: hypothetical protein EAZ47_11115 [Bacteroidetes bacterium]|nr:MAG: hypothetical protein EAZ47_11115 [Bacteroidota bacterium]
MGQAQSAQLPLGGYGAGVSELTWINGKPSLAVGAYGGVLINHRLLLGAAGNNIFFKQQVNGSEQSFQFNYYGLYTEYRMMQKEPINISLGVTGALGWQENDIKSSQKNKERDGKNTFVVQPKIAINGRVTKFMQLQVYGSYRFTGNTNSVYFSNKNYNGAAAGVGLLFGSF